MIDKENRIYWLDALKILSMFGVILLHVTTPIFNKYDSIQLSHWMTANLFDSAARMCVPIFFIISGYFLLQKSESISVYFRKRVVKVVVPLLLWSIIFLIWKKYAFDQNIDIYSFYYLLIGPVHFHLWFVYTLIGIYFVIPILRVFTQNARIELKYYFVIVWFLVVSILPLYEKLTGQTNQIDFLSISGFVGYFVIGNILRQKAITKKIFIFSIGIIILSYLFTVIGTHYVTVRSGTYNEQFYGYLSPNVITMSMAFFFSIQIFIA